MCISPHATFFGGLGCCGALSVRDRAPERSFRALRGGNEAQVCSLTQKNTKTFWFLSERTRDLVQPLQLRSKSTSESFIQFVNLQPTSGCFHDVFNDSCLPPSQLTGEVGLFRVLRVQQLQWLLGHQHHGGRVGVRRRRLPSRLPRSSTAADAVQAVVHVVLEEASAGVAELVEEQHEEHGQAVADQQLDGQQRRAHVLVEVRFVEVPERDEDEVLDEASAVVHGQAAPALLPLDELSVGEVQLHRRPAEDVDAGVEQREHAQHHRGAQLGEVLLHVLSQRAFPGPELSPGEEEEEEQVHHPDEDHPVCERRAEEDQSGDPGGDLQPSPHDHAHVGRGAQPHLVVVVPDLDGEDAAHQGPVYDGDQGDDHQSA